MEYFDLLLTVMSSSGSFTSLAELFSGRLWVSQAHIKYLVHLFSVSLPLK